MDPKASAEWVINRVEDYLEPLGAMVHPETVDIFRTPVPELGKFERDVVALANNVGVDAIRTMITLEKRLGTQTVRVRWGLSLPVDWLYHYQAIYTTNFPWFISAVMQNAFLQNPGAGESKKWRSP